MRLYAFTPMIVGAILTFVSACFFPLTKKKMDDIRAQLDARHAAAHIPGVEGGPSAGI
jgi:Na+/melibiose symporter-like transporter